MATPSFSPVGSRKSRCLPPATIPRAQNALKGAAKGISHLEFRIKRADKAYWDEKLRAAGYHAYGDNYEDEDGNLFHFVYED